MSKRKKKDQTPAAVTTGYLEDQLLERAKSAFCEDMDCVAALLKRILDRHAIPITGKMDIDERKQVKAAISEFLFAVFDSSAAGGSDEEYDGSHLPVRFENYQFQKNLPDSFFEGMRQRAATEFVGHFAAAQSAEEIDKLLGPPLFAGDQDGLRHFNQDDPASWQFGGWDSGPMLIPVTRKIRP